MSYYMIQLGCDILHYLLISFMLCHMIKLVKIKFYYFCSKYFKLFFCLFMYFYIIYELLCFPLFDYSGEVSDVLQTAKEKNLMMVSIFDENVSSLRISFCFFLLRNFSLSLSLMEFERFKCWN